VFDDQTGYGNGLGNRLLGNPAIPFPNDFVPGHAILDLFEHDPHHDARALERGLAPANPRVGHNVPAQLDTLASSVVFRLHADAPHYAPARTCLQASSRIKKVVRNQPPFAMKRMKAVPPNKPENGGRRRRHRRTAIENKMKTMKTLKTIGLAAMMLATTLAAQAGPVRGYFRSNGTYMAPSYRSSYGSVGRTSSRSYNSGYVYRSPYAAYPSVNVHGYYRSNGTYVMAHVRTPPDSTVTDNLNNRGSPSVWPSYVAPRCSPLDAELSRPRTMPYYGSSRLDAGILLPTGASSPRPLFRTSGWSGSDF
jgi:hypothetical protein